MAYAAQGGIQPLYIYDLVLDCSVDEAGNVVIYEIQDMARSTYDIETHYGSKTVRTDLMAKFEYLFPERDFLYYNHAPGGGQPFSMLAPRKYVPEQRICDALDFIYSPGFDPQCIPATFQKKINNAHQLCYLGLYNCKFMQRLFIQKYAPNCNPPYRILLLDANSQPSALPADALDFFFTDSEGRQEFVIKAHLASIGGGNFFFSASTAAELRQKITASKLTGIVTLEKCINYTKSVQKKVYRVQVSYIFRSDGSIVKQSFRHIWTDTLRKIVFDSHTEQKTRVQIHNQMYYDHQHRIRRKATATELRENALPNQEFVSKNLLKTFTNIYLENDMYEQKAIQQLLKEYPQLCVAEKSLLSQFLEADENVTSTLPKDVTQFYLRGDEFYRDLTFRLKQPNMQFKMLNKLILIALGHIGKKLEDFNELKRLLKEYAQACNYYKEKLNQAINTNNPQKEHYYYKMIKSLAYFFLYKLFGEVTAKGKEILCEAILHVLNHHPLNGIKQLRKYVWKMIEPNSFVFTLTVQHLEIYQSVILLPLGTQYIDEGVAIPFVNVKNLDFIKEKCLQLSLQVTFSSNKILKQDRPIMFKYLCQTLLFYFYFKIKHSLLKDYTNIALHAYQAVLEYKQTSTALFELYQQSWQILFASDIKDIVIEEIKNSEGMVEMCAGKDSPFRIQHFTVVE